MELMQKKEIKKPKQNHTSDISFMQTLKKKKQGHMVDYIYFKTSFQLCKQKLKWFVVSPVFNSSINIANTFPDCIPEERQEMGPEITTSQRLKLLWLR